MSDESTTTGHDVPRPAATDRENDFLLSIEEVSERYARAGHPRTIRTLQRYSASGHLDAQKVATTLGDKYLVTPQSVARHIAQIEELRALDNVARDRDLSRPVATSIAAQQSPPVLQPERTTHDDSARQSTTDEREVSRYVDRLEREVEQAKDERDFLREQIDRKDKTIDSLIERDRETNILVPRTLGNANAIARRTAARTAGKRPPGTLGSEWITRKIGKFARYTQHMDHIAGRLNDIARNIEIVGADPATRHGFTMVPNFILTNKDLSVGAKLAYAMLLKYAWADSAVYPGQQALAIDMGAGERALPPWKTRRL